MGASSVTIWMLSQNDLTMWQWDRLRRQTLSICCHRVRAAQATELEMGSIVREMTHNLWSRLGDLNPGPTHYECDFGTRECQSTGPGHHGECIPVSFCGSPYTRVYSQDVPRVTHPGSLEVSLELATIREATKVFVSHHILAPCQNNGAAGLPDHGRLPGPLLALR